MEFETFLKLFMRAARLNLNGFSRILGDRQYSCREWENNRKFLVDSLYGVYNKVMRRITLGFIQSREDAWMK